MSSAALLVPSAPAHSAKRRKGCHARARHSPSLASVVVFGCLQSLIGSFSSVPIARYLAHGDPNPAKHDASAWGDVVSSLNAQAIGAEEQWLWWQMIAAILQLGNVQFDEGKPDAATVLPAAKSAITEVEVLLSIGKGTFEKGADEAKDQGWRRVRRAGLEAEPGQ